MLDFLYENIGAKLKSLAKFTFVIEAIGSVITGIVLTFDQYYAAYLLICVFGPIVAWVSSWILYAIGQIAEDASIIRNKQQTLMNTPETMLVVDLPIEPASDFIQTQVEKKLL